MKQNRRDKEQKKREQAASMISIPKPLPHGAQPLPIPDKKDPGDSKSNSTESGMPTLDWPVKRMRQFCEEHLVPVTRHDDPQAILDKIQQSIKDNGGKLREKGGKSKKKVSAAETPKPRPKEDGDGPKDEDRKDRKAERREREEAKRKERRDKKAEDKVDYKGDTAAEDRPKALDKDKAKSGGVPTLESQGCLLYTSPSPRDS